MGFALTFILSSLFFGTVWAQKFSPRVDPNKFTICAITLNSTNERDAFKKSAAKHPTKFNPIVELTDFGDDWFKKSCQSNIRCDQLIISGHHSGGEFYSDNGDKSLTHNQLIAASCAKTCEGILNKPLEVFLFACTTMDGEILIKQDEHLLQKLLDLGVPKSQAGLLSERKIDSRSNRQDFQIAFSGAKKRIHGFTVRAPLGPQIEPSLQAYFREINPAQRLTNLRDWRTTEQASILSSMDKILKKHLVHTTLDSCSAGQGTESDAEILDCRLKSDLPLEKKIDFLVAAFSKEKSMRFYQSYNHFILENGSALTDAQKRELRAITGNEIIKRQVRNTVSKLNNDEEFDQLVMFGLFIGAVDQETIKKLEKNISDRSYDLQMGFLSYMNEKKVLTADGKENILYLRDSRNKPVSIMARNVSRKWHLQCPDNMLNELDELDCKLNSKIPAAEKMKLIQEAFDGKKAGESIALILQNAKEKGLTLSLKQKNMIQAAKKSFEGCQILWKRYDGYLDAERSYRCQNIKFSQCMIKVGKESKDGRVDSGVEDCYYNKDFF